MAWENDASGKACILKAVVQLRVTKTAQLNHSQIGRAPRGCPSRQMQIVAPRSGAVHVPLRWARRHMASGGFWLHSYQQRYQQCAEHRA